MTDTVTSRPVSIDHRGGTLTREIGLTGVFFFSLTGIGLFTSGQLPFSTVLGIWPGVNLLPVVAIGAGVSLLLAFTFSSIGAAVRRPGADYLLASRTLPPSLAFASSWCFVIFSALFVGLLVAWASQTMLPAFVRMYGLLGSNSNYLNLAETLATPHFVAMVGTTIVVGAFGLTAVRPRTLAVLFQAGILAALVGLLIIFLQLGLAAEDAFPAAWNRFMGAGGYAARIGLAQSLGMVLNDDARSVLAAGSIAGVWMFFGAIFPTLAASEVKRPEKTLYLGSWAAIGVAGLLFVLVILFLQRLAPVEWLSAESFLATQLATGQAMPWIPFYAAILQSSPFLVVILGVVWCVSLANLVQLILFYTSRVVLAWAEDGLLPAAFAYVQPRRKTPLVAMFFVAVLALAAMVFFAQSPGSQPMLSFIVYLALPLVIPVLAAILFPFTRPDWFRQAEGITRWRIGPLPVMSLAGLVVLAYLVWLFVLVFINPARGLGVEREILAAPLVVFLAGLAWFFVRRRNLGAREDDWVARFRSLPPSRTEEDAE